MIARGRCNLVKCFLVFLDSYVSLKKILCISIFFNALQKVDS